ncbi:MAG: putative polymerase ECF-subfamily sigma factor [Frankiales bacterium]|nr:putative polymerase ECF-subfamily sigma factor [Frankiales bacterium]
MQPARGFARDDEFARYVAEHRQGLLRTARFLTAGDSHAAEDLVQTALMRVYVAWPRVRQETADAYARRAVLNALIDESRRGFTRHERAQDVLPEPLPAPSPADTDEALYAALAGLPPRMRAAVVLRFFCDLSVTDAARELSCSEGTIKSQTARALTHLRTTLSLQAPTQGVQP